MFPDGFGAGEILFYNVGVGVSLDQTSGETELPRQIVAHSADVAIIRTETNRGTVYTLDVISAQMGYINGETQVTMTVPPVAGSGEEGAVAQLLADAMISFTIDGDGNVQNIQGNEDFVVTAEESNLAPQLFGMFTDAQLAQTLTSMLRPADLVGSERELGSSWAETNSFPVSNAAVFDFVSTWTLGTMDEESANLSSTVALSLRRPADVDDSRAMVSLNTHEGMQSLVFNREIGVSDQFRSTHAMTTTWTLGELSIMQIEESTVIIERQD